MSKIASVLVSLLLASVLVCALPGSPAVADGKREPVSIQPALRNCVDYVLKKKFQQWVCTERGATLTTASSSAGSHSRFIAIKSGVRPWAPRARGAIAQADDYDSWCENGRICSREKSAYISETKGNAAYGDNRGAIGSFDIIVRTNLNGRQAQWRVVYIWDSGPTITFQWPGVTCWDKGFLGLWYSCGTYVVSNGSTAPKVSRNAQRWNSYTLYSDKLNNNDMYHGEHNSYFTPTGYPRFTAASLDTHDFTCFPNSNCRF